MRFADLKHLTPDKPQESIDEELQRITQEEEDSFTNAEVENDD